MIMNVKEVPHAPRMQIVPIRMDLLIVLANLDLKETGLLVTVSEILNEFSFVDYQR